MFFEKLSWTEPHKTARAGEIKLRVFDEEGFSALKKAQRNNEELSKVKELYVLALHHPVRILDLFKPSRRVSRR